jgi:hypothetical protein
MSVDLVLGLMLSRCTIIIKFELYLWLDLSVWVF